MRARRRSNTALFRACDGNQADISTFQDAAGAAPRIPGAQPHARRPRGASQPARQGAPASRAVAAAGKRFGIDRGRRLRQKAQFERLLRQGTRRNLGGFSFFFLRRAAGAPKLGILVSKKHSRLATERNRLKRCVREAFRLEQEALGAVDLLVRPPYGIRPSSEMLNRLRRLLQELART